MKSWLHFEFQPDILAQISFSYSELTKLVFTLQPQLCKNQSKCISHLIISTSGVHSNPAMETAKRDIGTYVISLVGLIGPALTEKNEDMITCFQTIFTTLGQTYMDKIMEDPASEFYGILLKLLSYPKGKIWAMCKFWKNLFKGIYTMKSEELKKAKVESLQAIFKSALMTCVDLMQLHEDVFLALNKTNINDEEFAEVRDARYHYRKIIKYIGACLGGKDSWIVIRDRFKQDIEAVAANPSAAICWSRLEAVLATLGPLLTCNIVVLNDLCDLDSTAIDMEFLKDLFPLILSMTKDSVQLQRSIIQILSSVSSVMAAVEPVFKQALRHLFECVEIPLLKEEASEVLLKLLDDNKAFIAENELLGDLLTGNFVLSLRFIASRFTF